MKKDIEWLVKMINDERENLRQRFESGKGTPNETTFNEGRDWALAHVLRMIYRLDKLEVLSQGSKDIEWLKGKVWEQDTAIAKDYIYIRDLICLIDQLDEPVVLSQEENINIVLNDLKEYIKEQQSLSQNVGLAHTSAGNDTHYRQYDYVLECIDEYEPSDDLQNPLVPKQEELESKIKVLIEAYKQEDGAYSNPENGWISGFVEDLENLVEEEPLYYALIKGHELIAGEDACKYWKCDMRNGGMFLSNRYSQYGRYLAKMSKNDWGKFGINDTNADFVKAEE